jgi:hypothetical protein
MSYSQSIAPHSDFDSLPPELMSMVLGRLVGQDCPPPKPELRHNARSWATQTRNKPKFDTAILRANKGFYALAKSFLDRDNHWSIFDVDNAYLLHPWVSVLVLTIVIKPEDDVAALPQGILRVRVKMCLSGIPYAETLRNVYPPSMPHRQIFLVQFAYSRLSCKLSIKWSLALASV